MKFSKMQTDAELEEVFKNCLNKVPAVCSNCGYKATIKFNRGFYSRCNYKLCNKRELVTKYSIFYNSRLENIEILKIIRYWLSKVPLACISELTGLSYSCIKRYINKVRKFIDTNYLPSLGQIGGPNIIVEVDESKFGKRKYHRGHHVEGVWVLGMVERTPDRKIILIPVPDRKASTLEACLRRFVHPESRIYSDCWKGYSKLADSFTEHSTVNHSVSFVDFITNVHTNTIEGNWAGIKKMFLFELELKKS